MFQIMPKRLNNHRRHNMAKHTHMHTHTQYIVCIYYYRNQFSHSKECMCLRCICIQFRGGFHLFLHIRNLYLCSIYIPPHRLYRSCCLLCNGCGSFIVRDPVVDMQITLYCNYAICGTLRDIEPFLNELFKKNRQTLRYDHRISIVSKILSIIQNIEDETYPT